MESTHILPEKKLFRPSEVARHLNISIKTVYSWCDSGKLQYVRVGEKCIRIHRDDLLTIISID